MAGKKRHSNRTRSGATVARCVACAMTLAALASPAHGQTLRGLLLERATQAPIPLGRVTLITEERDSVAAALTDESGFFSVTAPEEGSYRLVASALGYRGSLIGPYDLEEGSMQVVELQLETRPVPLPGIVVSAERLAEPEVASLVSTGFYDRLFEGKGEFLTPGEIARHPATYTPQLFREMQLVDVAPAWGTGAGPWNDRVMIRFLAVVDIEAGMTAEERRRRREAIERSEYPRESRICEPRLFVDGRHVQPNPGESLDDVVPKDELEAVEVYRAPFGAPNRYQGTNQCGVVLLWTKRR